MNTYISVSFFFHSLNSSTNYTWPEGLVQGFFFSLQCCRALTIYRDRKSRINASLCGLCVLYWIIHIFLAFTTLVGSWIPTHNYSEYSHRKTIETAVDYYIDLSLSTAEGRSADHPGLGQSASIRCSAASYYFKSLVYPVAVECKKWWSVVMERVRRECYRASARRARRAACA